MATLHSLEDVVAASIAAYQLNGQTIVRDAKTDSEGRVVKPNRELVESMLASKSSMQIDVQHRNEARDLIAYMLQAETMEILTKGSISNSFLDKMHQYVKKDSVKGRDVGMLVWLPKIYENYQKRDKVRLTNATFEFQSRYIGSVGEKITIEFTKIEERYINKTNSWLVCGHDQSGNLVRYFVNDKGKIVDSGLITAKVKVHKKDAFTNNAEVTIINYIKIKK